MKRLFVFLLSVLLSASLLLFLFLRAHFGAEEAIEAPHAVSLPPEAGHARVKKTVVPRTKRGVVPDEPLEDGSLPKLEGNTIRFKVVDGLAIGFGDLLLGTPEDPEVKRGYYDAPAPQLWDRGEVPYFIAQDLPDPGRVERALDYFRQHTALRFIPYNGQPDAIVFEPGHHHCYSLLGRVGGQQPISLEPGCGPQEILHELMHALGFVHEQSRTDRDQFVDILWPNIDDEYKDQFAVVPESFMDAQRNTSFDYHSVMLYRPADFARQQGMVTMRSKTGSAIQPVAQGLSEGDLEKLGRVYPK